MDPNAPDGLRLHLGCGRDILPGWVNCDITDAPGVDITTDLDSLAVNRLPLGDDTVSEILASHLLEHLRNPLPFMQELHRVAKPGASMQIRVPYGSSDCAFEDPTHHRQYFLQSFMYFSQPAYCRADYGYRGDWHTQLIRLFVGGQHASRPAATVMGEIQLLRNTVIEMQAFLVAVKPIRPALPDSRPTTIEIIATTPGQPDVVLT